MVERYDGGISEPELVAAMARLLDDNEDGTIARIKNVDWMIGQITEIAIGLKFVAKAGGLKLWAYKRFERGETHIRNCLHAWGRHRNFDEALKWYRTGNTGFTPSKTSGPLFCVELVDAF